MKTTETYELLRAFAQKESEAAFRELVKRYVDLVYSVAVRRVDGDTQLAEDVTQQVFTDLARKARSLPPDVMLGGWLHRHTGFVASTAMRGERRRRDRERQAMEMNALNEPSTWKQLAPVLDEAMDELETAERDALVLRYFERLDLRAVGAALGVSDDTAQKRVSRALEKLRGLLDHRGATGMSAAALSLVLGESCVQSAPAGLGIKVSEAALSTTAAASRAGLLAVALKLLTSGAGKLAAATAVALAITGVLLFSHHPENQRPTAVVVAAPETNSSAPVVKVEPSQEPVQPQLVASTVSIPSSNRLDLLIVAADSGKPVPNVQIDYRSWQGGKFKGQQLSADRMGLCHVPVPQEKLTELELTTRTDGFADTRLLWRPDRGEQIPGSYTLRLARPVFIGGSVVDADGQPVAEAKVGFNHEDDPASRTLPESHEFGWIEVKTDAEGHWSINRIAPEMIRRIYGGASHPEHVGSAFIWTSRDAQAEKELRAGTFTFRLGRAVTVRGIVVNPEGDPVPGAKVLVGMRGMGGSREAKTGEDGTFEAKGCPLGTNLLSAEAAGFSATTTQVLVSAESEPFRLTLARGAVLRMRVVGRGGEPVANANLWLDTMHQRPINAPDYGAIAVQANFKKKTDAEGRMVWSNAPSSDLEFDVAASGYMRTNWVKVKPDGQEHVVVLAPALVISGSVRDADTGQPIPRFRIITGWPQDRWGASQDGTPASSVHGQWPTIGRFWVDYSGGAYRHVLEEPAIVGMANPGYMLKIEAEDYAPLISRVIAADEGNIQMDVTLQRATATQVTVLLPDGTPAAAADIGLVAPGAQLQLTPGGFARQGGGSGTALLRADANGHFRLSGDPSVSRVAVAHPAGYAEVTPADLIQNPALVLQPWGRLEGTYLSGGRPLSGGDLLLAFLDQEATTFGFDFMSFKVKTDAEGHFVFPKAPPGKLKLIRLAHVPPNGFSHVIVPDGDVEIRAGETTTKVFGATGYTVKARARWPEDTKPGKGWHFFASLASPPPPALLAAAQAAQAGQDSAALAALQDSPDARDYAKKSRNIQAEVSEDYTITAENVPPGDYIFSATAFPEANGAGAMTLGMSGYSANITVPSDPPNGTLDAGEIVLSKPRLADSK